jgi:hypothetical protein
MRMPLISDWRTKKSIRRELVHDVRSKYVEVLAKYAPGEAVGLEMYQKGPNHEDCYTVISYEGRAEVQLDKLLNHLAKEQRLSMDEARKEFDGFLESCKKVIIINGDNFPWCDGEKLVLDNITRVVRLPYIPLD